MIFTLFVSCPKGIEYLLEEELKPLGLHVTRVSPQGVYGEANLTTVYQIILWSRLANRVQLILFSGQAHNEQTIYQLCSQFPWQTIFSVEKTLAIEFHGSSEQIRNTMYGAQLVKDAISDHFRKLQGARPSIERKHPDILLHAHLKNEELTLSFDLVGYSLHQRGYRQQAGAAPLKENIAAALLVRAKWPQLAAQGYTLHDPFCGSGTLVIEAAMMAAHIAPGLIRDDHALCHWVSHHVTLWEKMRVHALQEVKPFGSKLRGTDLDQSVIDMARANADRAGVASLVEFTTLPMNCCEPHAPKGLLIGNPPYGERLGDVTPLMPMYQQLGTVLNQHYQGWHAAILTSSTLLAKAIGLRSQKQYTVFNGAIECKLYCITLNQENRLKTMQAGAFAPGAEMLLNRLQKNYHHLKKWAKRNSITCYRVYDADLPEYAYAIDIYKEYAVLQEYQAPATVDHHKAEKRSLEVMQVVPIALNISPEHIVIKQRRQQKGNDQYQKLNQSRHHLIVQEGNVKLKVNLFDYLDTGLFLDHRLLRLRFAELPPETRFLNCFCYTATASVHAAIAGAITTNVDLSNTYLAWAEENFKLNGCHLSRHQFIQYDCLQWLKITRDRFDVIFLDPPSFSNSKRMTETLDVQRDHAQLINHAMRLLNPSGTLYFSTNFRQFKLANGITERYNVRDISMETLDVDFKRNKRIHQCYLIQSRMP